MRLILRAGRAAVAALDAVSTLCLGVILVLYGLAWAVSWPFAATARRSLALSRRISSGAAGSPASPLNGSRVP